jgi:monoamine oxidase
MARQRPHYPDPTPVDTDVIIVGGGVAGLYAAWLLKKADIPFILLEAAAATGGRVQSHTERFTHLGLTIDDGANLINSTDTIALKLMDRFGITYVRRLKSNADSMNYLVNGVLYDQAGFDTLLFQDSRSAVNQIMHDDAAWTADTASNYNPRFIDESIAAYLKRIDAGPVLTAMLKSFFWSEYGHEITNLNLYVLFDYLDINATGPAFQLIPNVDEAYTVPQGTVQIAAALEDDVKSSIRYGHRAASIIDEERLVRVIASAQSGEQHDLTCRHIFFAAPLHSLNGITVKMEGLSQHAIDAAKTSSYASGTKLHLKFDVGFSDRYGYTGILLTDTGEQIWTSGTGQSGAGLLTVLTGPLPPGRAEAVFNAGRVLKSLDLICPGLSDIYAGVERSDAPQSYSGSLHPGEYAHLAIHDGGARWTTMGEASGKDLQGYLEGALRSADRGAARYILRRRKKVS